MKELSNKEIFFSKEKIKELSSDAVNSLGNGTHITIVCLQKHIADVYMFLGEVKGMSALNDACNAKIPIEPQMAWLNAIYSVRVIPLFQPVSDMLPLKEGDSYVLTDGKTIAHATYRKDVWGNLDWLTKGTSITEKDSSFDGTYCTVLDFEPTHFAYWEQIARLIK